MDDSDTFLSRAITYCGRDAVLACDGKCSKAWGINGGRPKISFDPKDPDDYAYLPDQDVGEAPDQSDIGEGGHGKPRHPEDRLNKWCARECERSSILSGDDMASPADHLPDFSNLHYNMPSRHPESR